MIVIIGSPIAVASARVPGAGGLAAEIARHAAQAGTGVEVVGRVGEDAAGDAVLLSLAEAQVGHVAILRESGRLTPSVPSPELDAATPDGPDPGEAVVEVDGPLEAEPDHETGLSMDAADLDLALRYLPDYRVVVVADDLDTAALATVVAAAAWAGAHLVLLVSSDRATDDLPPAATVLERPPRDPDGAFARVVASYAVGLDQGREPRAAFSEASGGGGWAAVSN